AAALADLADHAAVGTAIRRTIAAAENFLLVDRAIGQGDAAETAQRIGGVEAVEVVRVFRHRRAGEGHQRIAGRAGEAAITAYGARSEQGDRFGAASERQGVELLRGDDRA